MKIVVFFLFSLSILVAHAKEITVCKECPLTSIQQAVDEAESGDSIRIKSGTYFEHEINMIDKSLHIIGEDFPVVDAQFQGNAFSIRAENFTIEGLKIINIGTSHTNDFAAILVSRSKNFEIKNNRLENIFFGILLERSSEGKVIGNQIKGDARDQANSGNGIHLWHSNNMLVKNNRVVGVRDGIYLEFSSESTLSQNFCKDNLRYGLHFMFSNKNEYLENIFENNGAGVAVMYSKFIKMYRNTFRKNWGSASYGLLLKDIDDAELKNNYFLENTIAISADNTNRIHYEENEFRNNGYAVRIRGAVYKNYFTRNNFLYNSFDVAYTGRINENEFSGNFWSDYTGYDLNKDGVGDVPYRPVKLFSYLVNRTPEAIILLRSMFIDLVDFSEKVSPIFTPAELIDDRPQMRKIQW